MLSKYNDRPVIGIHGCHFSLDMRTDYKKRKYYSFNHCINTNEVSLSLVLFKHSVIEFNKLSFYYICEHNVFFALLLRFRLVTNLSLG